MITQAIVADTNFYRGIGDAALSAIIAAEARKGLDQGRSDAGVPKIKDLAGEHARGRRRR